MLIWCICMCNISIFSVCVVPWVSSTRPYQDIGRDWIQSWLQRYCVYLPVPVATAGTPDDLYL